MLAVSHAGGCMSFFGAAEGNAERLGRSLGNRSIFIYDYEDGKFTFVDIAQPCE